MGRVSVYIWPAAMNMTFRVLEHSIHYSDDNNIFVFRVLLVRGVDLIVISTRIDSSSWSVRVFGKEFLIYCTDYLVFDFDIVSVEGAGVLLNVSLQSGQDAQKLGRLWLSSDGTADFNGERIETIEARRFNVKAATLWG